MLIEIICGLGAAASTDRGIPVHEPHIPNLVIGRAPIVPGRVMVFPIHIDDRYPMTRLFKDGHTSLDDPANAIGTIAVKKDLIGIRRKDWLEK